MSILQAAGVGILCALTALVLRESKSPLAALLPLCGGLALLLLALPRLSAVTEIAALLEGAVDAQMGIAVSKVLAVGFITSIGCDICTDLGAPTLAERLDLCGKLEILLLTLPTLKALLSAALEMLS